jgi:hypothetical protein
MVQSSEVRQHTVKTASVLGTNMVRLPQVALPLGRFLGEDVALVGVAALVLAGSGLPEAFGCRPIGLDLGHCDVLSEVYVTGLGGGTMRDEARATLSVLPLPACKSLIYNKSTTGP